MTKPDLAATDPARLEDRRKAIEAVIAELRLLADSPEVPFENEVRAQRPGCAIVCVVRRKDVA